MRAIARKAAAPIFAVALFSSAALLFALQPMFGRMVTPLLGGSPAVWNASMAFFQGALLVGYLYAHLLSRLRDPRLQGAIHAFVLVAAWFALPIHVSTALGPPSSHHPALWLLGVLTASVGAPFAAAAATAPLLQSWYARTGRADAHDPYYLYAASNLGSFAGLLAYPVLAEPLLGLQAQSGDWQIGYALVAALIALAAAAALAEPGARAQGQPRSPSPPLRQRLYWIGAAAVPSALSLGVTLHISTDVASAPMLWVVPLAIYLLTFVVAFMRNGERLARGTLFMQPAALALLIVGYFFARNWIASLASILVGFFFAALVCHQALARSRPAADRLTEFYLLVSLGGVLGGAFAAFMAPVIFNNVYEYPLALAAACLLRPHGETRMGRLANCAVAAGAAMVGVALILLWLNALEAALVAGAIGGAAALVAAGWGADEERPAPVRYAFLLAAALYSALVIYVAFNAEIIFVRTMEEGTAHLNARAPWGGLLMGLAFVTLTFVVHASVQFRRDQRPLADAAMGAAIPGIALMVALPFAGERLSEDTLIFMGMGLCAIGFLFNGYRPRVLACLVLAAFAIFFLDDNRGGRIITQERSFFGVLRTKAVDYPSKPADGPVEMRILMHGTTIHGAQLHGRGVSRTPLTYYNPQTALGEAILAGLSTGDSSSLALIGLGTGSTACLMANADRLTIFEIDPAVVRLSARPGGDFTFVEECQPHAQVRLGDARLGIAREPDHSFDVIVVDAFSSDAIPAHLLTREAIALYLSKTTDRGVVVLHLSNRNLALVSESARVAHALGVSYLFRVSEHVYEPGNPAPVGLPASVMILARRSEALAQLPLYRRSNWREIPAPAGRAWSDDYINLPRALWDNLSGVEECRIYPDQPRCRQTPP